MGNLPGQMRSPAKQKSFNILSDDLDKIKKNLMLYDIINLYFCALILIEAVIFVGCILL